MAAIQERSPFLQLPAELRLKIYKETCPCLRDKEDYCNPILCRRLGSPKSFVCYKCAGRVFLYVSSQTRCEISPILFEAHEFRFQLWADHKPALESWFKVIDEKSVSHIRRFRLHTQYPDESLELARSPGTATAMPGYIAVDLDASLESQIAVSSRTWTETLLEQPRRQILEVAKGLPREDGRLRLTKEALLLIVANVGWFGTRTDRERQMLDQHVLATRVARG